MTMLRRHRAERQAQTSGRAQRRVPLTGRPGRAGRRIGPRGPHRGPAGLTSPSTRKARPSSRDLYLRTRLGEHSESTHSGSAEVRPRRRRAAGGGLSPVLMGGAEKALGRASGWVPRLPLPKESPLGLLEPIFPGRPVGGSS